MAGKAQLVQRHAREGVQLGAQAVGGQAVVSSDPPSVHEIPVFRSGFGRFAGRRGASVPQPGDQLARNRQWIGAHRLLAPELRDFPLAEHRVLEHGDTDRTRDRHPPERRQGAQGRQDIRVARAAAQTENRRLAETEPFRHEGDQDPQTRVNRIPPPRQPPPCRLRADIRIGMCLPRRLGQDRACPGQGHGCRQFGSGAREPGRKAVRQKGGRDLAVRAVPARDMRLAAGGPANMGAMAGEGASARPVHRAGLQRRAPPCAGPDVFLRRHVSQEANPNSVTAGRIQGWLSTASRALPAFYVKEAAEKGLPGKESRPGLSLIPWGNRSFTKWEKNRPLMLD